MASTRIARIAGVALAVCAGLVIACPAPAQVVACDEASAVLRILRDNYDELPVFRGMTDDHNVAVMTLSPKGTWSVVILTPDGTACLVGAGEDAVVLPPARPAGEPS